MLSIKIITLKINFDKHISEGWTVQMFIDDLQWIFDMIMRGASHVKPFTNKAEIKKWCMDNQPNYKKHIPEVYQYFVERSNLK